MSYSSEVLADSPLMYWRMDSGGTDSSGNSRTADAGVNGTSAAGLLAGDPTSTAVQFNGSGQYLQRSYGSWMAVSAFTVECWVKTTATTQQYLIARDNQPIDRIWALGHSLSGSAGKPYVVRLKNPGGTITAEVAQGTTSINDGNPHHLVGTYDGTNLKIYVDGSLQATTAASGGLYVAGVWLDVASNAGSLLFYNGTLDEVAFYGTALSSTRISAHYAAGSLASAGGTASLSLTASGGAAATSGGTASLSLTASGGANAAAGGSASLSLTAAGALTPPTPAAGAAALALTASGGASGSPGGTASLNLTATGTAIAVLAASGSATLTLTASGSAVMSAGGTATLTLSAGGVAFALYRTDLSNAMNGRGRHARATATVDRPAAALPPDRTFGVRHDKAIAYRVPTMIDGRPT